MRCYIAPEQWRSGRLVPGPDEAHHLLHVLRIEAGDTLEVFDGQGRTAEAVVEEVRHPELTLRPGPERHHERPRPEIVLVQALPKTQKMEWIVQKGTELGMGRLVPVVTHRVVVRPDERRAVKKRDRWAAVALGATRQCSSAWVPEIAPIQKLGRWLNESPRPERLLFGDLAPGAAPLKEALAQAASGSPSCIGMVIGPEGDFDETERAMLIDAGATPVGLGDAVLRTETAALYALSVMRYELR